MLQLPVAEHSTVLEGDELVTLQHPAGTFVIVGIDHSVAPVAIREHVALLDRYLEDAHRDLIANPAVDEVVILSTCNRTEMYMFTEGPDRAAEAASAYLLGAHLGVRSYLREWRGVAAVEHLLRVSAGLESRVLGEHQILSQVRKALSGAEQASTIGPHLHQLFRTGISCGREVRRATGLGRADASIAGETVRTAELLAGPLTARTALVIGGGEVSRQTAAELRRRGIARLYLANRTPSVAEDLAGRFGAVPVPFADIPKYLPWTDIVVTATSAPGRILTAEDVSAVQLAHRREPLHVFDLAVPSDVDSAIGDLPGVVLHDLDGLDSERVWERRAEDIRSAELIVVDRLREFERWYRIRRTAPLITQLRRQLDEAAASELQSASRRLAPLSRDERDAVERLVGRLSDAIFHRFVTRLRLAAEVDDEQVVAAAAFFFGGDTDPSREPVPIRVRSMEPMEGMGGER